MVDKVKVYLDKLMPLEEQDFALLMSIAQIRNFDKKIIVVYEGEIEPYLNLVVKGLVRKYFLRGDEEVVTQLASEGDLVSSADSFLSEGPSLYCTETIEPTTFLSFSKESIELLFKNNPKWQRLGRLLMSQLLIEKEYVELEKIRLTTQERFAKFINENPGLVARVPQKFLASYLGIQPETFSRLKNQYKESMATA
ncbi:MAG: Crp/Fnr family transcriptional regulator [Flavitalea sp.]